MHPVVHAVALCTADTFVYSDKGEDIKHGMQIQPENVVCISAPSAFFKAVDWRWSEAVG